jgi:short-chain fatty acids transporter
MASLVTLKTLPVAAFVLGGAVNFSIPSAGGEWAVIGPPLVEAVRELAGPVGTGEINRQVARVAMAVAYGESLTNLQLWVSASASRRATLSATSSSRSSASSPSSGCW